MEKWRKRLDIIANVALTLCCIVFMFFLFKNYFIKSTGNKDTQKNSPASEMVGKSINLGDINWAENEKNLILVLNKNCRFCNESAPFYQRLTNDIAKQTNTRLIAVLPHEDEVNKQYLKEHSLEISNIINVSSLSVSVRSTPTLILVDNKGVIVEQWVGKLANSDAENKVIAALSQ